MQLHHVVVVRVLPYNRRQEFREFLRAVGLDKRDNESELEYDEWVYSEFNKADTDDRKFLNSSYNNILGEVFEEYFNMHMHYNIVCIITKYHI